MRLRRSAAPWLAFAASDVVAEVHEPDVRHGEGDKVQSCQRARSRSRLCFPAPTATATATTATAAAVAASVLAIAAAYQVSYHVKVK